MTGDGEARDGVPLTNLDQPLFDGAGATKRDLVDYLDAVRDRIIPVLRDRPLSVVRMLREQAPFMQKNLPRYAPAWIRTVSLWAESSRREVSYALCDDRRTLLWFANQRAVEYHPTLVRATHGDRPDYLVLDLDPPTANPDAIAPDTIAPDAADPKPAKPDTATPDTTGPNPSAVDAVDAVDPSPAGTAGATTFHLAVGAALLVRRALAEAGLVGAVKTSGSKGLHVFVPIMGETAADAAAATRAIAARAERLDPALATTAFIREDRGGKVFVDSTRAGGATVVAAYSPRLRPGVPVSFPLPWEELGRVSPADFTVHTAIRLLNDGDPWTELMPPQQRLPAGLVEEGHTIPVARVRAMHEGKRRARARRS